MQKNGTLDDYLKQFEENAAKRAAIIYRELDEEMVFSDKKELMENQRRNRIGEMTREFMIYD